MPPKKYDHIDFTPPKDVQAAAKRGLEQRRETGRGGLDTRQAGKAGIGSGVARAATLAAGRDVSPETVKRMKAFFDRHSGQPGSEKQGSPRDTALKLWGGKPGERWSNKVVRQMKAADEKAKR